MTSQALAAQDAALRKLTVGPASHFFGYYDRCPWDPDNRRLLALRVLSSCLRAPRAEDGVAIGTLEPENGPSAIRPIGTSYAWNYQQGCMQHWLSNDAIIYNDRDGGQFVSRICNVTGAEVARLPRPVYAVAPEGEVALTLNFSRLARTRPGYGYAGVADPTAAALCPSDDGVWRLDLRSGASTLLLSLAEIAHFEPQRGMKGAEHWCNHLTFSPDGRRFVFLHRWRTPRPAPSVSSPARRPRRRNTFLQRLRMTAGWVYQGVTGRRYAGHLTRMLVANTDGTGLRCVIEAGMVSHFCWRDDSQILAWCSRPPLGARYRLISVDSGSAEVLGDGVLTRDGHCTYSPDRCWILTDTYPDESGHQTLLLYNVESRATVQLGRFLVRPDLNGELRCDLHPRFDRHGKRVCFDSTHAGTRQMYCLDVSETVEC